MQKQTQTYAEKVRQEERGPRLVWAYLGLIKSLQQRTEAERKYRRAQPMAMERELQGFLECSRREDHGEGLPR